MENDDGKKEGTSSQPNSTADNSPSDVEEEHSAPPTATADATDVSTSSRSSTIEQLSSETNYAKRQSQNSPRSLSFFGNPKKTPDNDAENLSKALEEEVYVNRGSQNEVNVYESRKPLSFFDQKKKLDPKHEEWPKEMDRAAPEAEDDLIQAGESIRKSLSFLDKTKKADAKHKTLPKELNVDEETPARAHTTISFSDQKRRWGRKTDKIDLSRMTTATAEDTPAASTPQEATRTLGVESYFLSSDEGGEMGRPGATHMDVLPGATIGIPVGAEAEMGVPGAYMDGVDRLEGSALTQQPRTNNVEPTIGGAALSSGSIGLAQARPVMDEGTILDMEAQPIDMDELERRDATRNWQKRAFVCVSMTMVCLALAVGLSMGLSRRKGVKDQISTPYPSISMAPSASPSMASTSIADKILESLPSSTKIEIQGSDYSPQSRAFDWLLNDPYLHLLPEWRILQRYALATTFYAMKGQGWLNTDSWLNHSAHECSWWYGQNINEFVDMMTHNSSCNQDPTELDLLEQNEGIFQHFWILENNAAGTLPPEFFLLTNLLSFVIDTARMSGSIPSEIGKLSMVEELQFVGGEKFSGSIPTEMGLLTNLRALWLFNNALTGQMPSELGQLTKLLYLYTEQNSLNGTIPTEFGRLSSLAHMWFGQNEKLGGTLPSELGQLSKLEMLFLPQNSHNGTIPLEIWGIPSLEAVSFQDNMLSGSLPPELANGTNLWFIEVMNNQITGTIPTELGTMENLDYLAVDINQLTGPLPSEFGSMKSLTRLWLNENNLSGTIPTEFGRIATLDTVVLRNNSLTGRIPSELGLLDLIHLSLEGNELSGTVPPDLCFLNKTAYDCNEQLCGCECECLHNGTGL